MEKVVSWDKCLQIVSKTSHSDSFYWREQSWENKSRLHKVFMSVHIIANTHHQVFIMLYAADSVLSLTNVLILLLVVSPSLMDHSPFWKAMIGLLQELKRRGKDAF